MHDSSPFNQRSYFLNRLSGNILYGTTLEGGGAINGTVYSINLINNAYNILNNFSVTDEGEYYPASLLLSDNVIYGTTYYGGTNNGGCIYKMNIDGSGFVTLYSHGGTLLFSSDNAFYGSGDGSIFSMNVDGSGLHSLVSTNADCLILSGNTFYGATASLDINYTSSMFSVNTNGTNYRALHQFTNSAA